MRVSGPLTRPSLSAAEGLVAGHQSLRKDIMTFLDYMIYLSINDEYAFFGRTKNILTTRGKADI